MPSNEKLERELRKMNERLDEQAEEKAKLEERLRDEMRELRREAPDGMAKMREGYAESDPAAIREARQAARKKGGAR